MNILLLEDEKSLRATIREYLEEFGYLIDEFGDGHAALEAALSKSYDLLLMDIKVPLKNGRQIALELREMGIKTPIIFITSLTSIDDIEEGYEAGCCDYIKKPFELKELYLRIKHVLKQSAFKSDSDLITLTPDYTFNIATGELTYQGRPIDLTKKERAIVALMVEKIGHVVSIDAFQSYIWGDYVDPANIRVQINNLRKKLPSPLIENLRGIGYRITKTTR